MITGAHSIIYSNNPEKDKEFFRNVLKFPFVDSGDGWLIFSLPPSEVAVHPSRKNNIYELYLMCDDIKGFAGQMRDLKVPCSPIEELSWGQMVHVKLPGGGKLKIYQPLHERPAQTGV
jgi:hypothetical protein